MVLLKIGVLVGAFYFIYDRLINNDLLSFTDFYSFTIKNDAFSVKNIIFLLILSFFNWFFEILKWQILVDPIKKLIFPQASEQTLGSLTASLLTPNRIGEYGAKAMFSDRFNRSRILLINLLGNMLQMSVTLLFGMIGFSIFISQNPLQFNYSQFLKAILIISGILCFLIIQFRFKKLSIRGYSLIKIRSFISNYPNKNTFAGFGLSVFRYLIFSFQFYFILHILGAELNYYDAMVVISSTYLLSSILPSIFVLDVIIKGSVALYLFTLIGISDLVILSAITIMWLFNFVFPSILGSMYVLKFKLPVNLEST
ncbi:lysylphosphatidylglycerol synthase domain-containing protein [Changchengzhania lutea]|uniref:lysylphosphatidylglycerol synthase domain-containing protein n=1 Tax=Changchengzhania lutea TaxID=2049305 RepID=UPI001FEB0C6A|nr:lysylphosphatidylglycerol synthase domain-containing protein [Changchengzhania lutea]